MTDNERTLLRITEKLTDMLSDERRVTMATLADIKAQIAALNTAVSDAVSKIAALTAQVANLGGNQAEIDSISSAIVAAANTLTAAVNPPAPAPVPTPEPTPAPEPTPTPAQ